MAQSYPPPQLGVPTKRSRGPVVLFLVLVVVLVVAVVGIVLIVLKGPNGTANDPSEPKHAAAGTLQFRRVVKVEPNACTKAPTTANVRCSSDGTRYTLGKVELDGTHVTEVQAVVNSQGVGWVVNLTLDAQGTTTFATLTADLVKQQEPANQLAIVVNDQVVSAPMVNGVISGGQVQITGNFTSDSAKKLAADITG
ncbi:SecDF P1 head subdomain-containing protein [Kribbella sp. NPDC051587]|uniref:SecDF P1 head subdomain-containing protein n=1 Tax=Kribbella sp. NPDC051587 TaxID=3364119 RepID=UPI0037B3C3C4